MNVRHRSSLWRRLARRLGRELFRIAENNEETRIARNGERWLLRELLRAHVRGGGRSPCVVMDAGANIGGYTRELLELAGEAGCAVDVHVFEPSPHCVEILCRDFAAAANVRIVATALADHVGDAVLHGGKAGSSQASLVARPGLTRDPAAALRVPVARLDEYLEAHSTGRVDLLKLDVEGFELAVLRGAGERLTPRCIDVIQFEYGGTTMDAGTTLRDLFELLGARGYTVAKLFPAALEVRDYAPWMENYAYSNYVALSPRWLQAHDGQR
jgi:FkbM family methyltransferase